MEWRREDGYDRCMKGAAYVAAGLAIVAFFIIRQRRSNRFVQRSLLFPLLLGLYGAFLVSGTLRHGSASASSVLLLSLSAVASIGFGIFRGRRIDLFVKDGELWERASWTTIVAGWGGLLVTRLLLIALAVTVGATLAASPTWIPLLLAVTLGAQILVETERARESGAALAESRRASRRTHRRARRL
jgi:hypothetical protein